jgi:nucleotide-binding universal stress UspA family protein
MSSHGRGRTAALLGSVVEDLLQREYGPIVVVGPHVAAADFTGPLIVPVDGSSLSEDALPLAAAWGIELGMVPWIIEVIDPDTVLPADVAETSYTARLAGDLQRSSGHEVEYDVVHGKHPAEAIADHAGRVGAGLIVATTHGRSGVARLTVGSTASGVVRHARCPVLLHRPPVLAGDAG